MKLNVVEKALMNNPVRAALQRRYEAHKLYQLGGAVNGGRALEIGCGRGVGIEIIFKRFGAATVDAFDLDPDMVERARRRLHNLAGVKLWAGSATAIDAEDDHYDAVFDFGIVHHVPDWRQALDEVARVLKPGGGFYFEEVTRHALQRWSYRTFMDHPKDDRFSGEEFIAALEERGINVGDRFFYRFFGDFIIGYGRAPQVPLAASTASAGSST